MKWRSILSRLGLIDVRLTPNARMLIDTLDTLSKGHEECWAGNAAIMMRMRCCERTVRNALAELAGAGLVEVVRDYTKTTRRRIKLLWRKAGDFFASVAANVSPMLTAPLAASSTIPPDPPIEEPEGNTVKSGGESAPPDSPAAPIAEADPAPPPEIVPAPIGDEDAEKARKRAYLEATVADAEKLFGPGRRAWVIAEAKALGRGLKALRAAIRRGLEKVAEGCKVTTGYVIRTADSMIAGGGPPPELADPEGAEADRKARSEQAAKVMDMTDEEYCLWLLSGSRRS